MSVSGPKASSTGQEFFAKFFERKTTKNPKHQITAKDFLIMIESKCTLIKSYTNLGVNEAGRLYDNDNGKMALVKLVDYLFNYMFLKFPVEPTALTDYIMFRNDYEKYLNGSRDWLEKLMSKKHSSPEVYIKLAIYQYSIDFDFNKASHYFNLGIKNHKKYKALYIELFWMEIHSMAMQNKMHSCNTMELYQKCIKNFKNNFQFHLQVLEKLIACNSNKHIQNTVLSDIKAKFRFELELADICVDNITNDEDAFAICLAVQRMLHKITLKEKKVTKIIQKRRNLWNICVDYVIEVWKSFSCLIYSAFTLLMNIITGVFPSTKKNELSEKHYFYLAEFFANDDQAIFKEVIEMTKDDPDVWTDFILNYTSPDQLVQKCDETLKEDPAFGKMIEKSFGDDDESDYKWESD